MPKVQKDILNCKPKWNKTKIIGLREFSQYITMHTLSGLTQLAHLSGNCQIELIWI